MLKFVPVAACLALIATPAFATDAKKTNDETKMVCKRVEGTGWRLSRQKVCKTQVEWDAESRSAQDEVKRDSRRDAS